MAYHAIIRDSDLKVVGTAGPDAIATVAAGHTLKEITKLRFDTLNAKGITVKDGRYRYLWNQITGEADEITLGLSVYLVAYDTATGNLTGSRDIMPWSKADKAGFVFTAGPGLSVYQATELEFQGLGKQNFQGTSVPRWKVVNDQLVEQTDSRDIIRFKNSNHVIITKIELPQFDTAPTTPIKLEVIDEMGNTRTDVTKTSVLHTVNGSRISVSVVDGFGIINVPRRQVHRDAVSATSTYRFLNEGEVFEINIYGEDM